MFVGDDENVMQPSSLCLLSVVISAALYAIQVSKLNTESTLNTVLHQHQIHNSYKDALLVVSGVAIPVLIDLIIAVYDFISGIDVNDFFCICARWTLFFSWVIPDVSILILFQRFGYSHSTTLRAVNLSGSFKLVSSICCISTILCRKSRRKEKAPRFNIAQQLVGLVLLSLLFQAFCDAGSHISSTNKIFATISSVLCSVILIQIVLIAGTWILDVRSNSGVDTKDNLIMGFLLVLLLLRCIACLVLILTEGSFSAGYANIGLNGATADLYLQIGFMVGCLLVPWHVEKSQTFIQMQATLEEKTSFMRFISHEVRAPLNVAGLSLSFLKSEASGLKSSVAARLLSPVLDAIADVESACKAAVSILNDVLLFDKMKGGKMELEIQTHHPVQIFLEFHRQFGIVAKQNNVNFVFECKGEEDGWTQEHSISIDAVRFGQVLRNLLTNAFKFTPAAGTVTIQVSCVETVDATASRSTSCSLLRLCKSLRWTKNTRNIIPDDRNIIPDDQSVKGRKMLHVEVIDSGAGISKENQKKLFGQYVQFNANSLQKGGGSGLGLWISKGIMSNHGGKLWAESEGEGLGSRFIVEIPLVVGGVAMDGDNAPDYNVDFDLLASLRDEGGQAEYHSSRRFWGGGGSSSHSGSDPAQNGRGSISGSRYGGSRFSGSIGSFGSSFGAAGGLEGISEHSRLLSRSSPDLDVFPDLEAPMLATTPENGSFIIPADEGDGGLKSTAGDYSVMIGKGHLVTAFGPSMQPVQDLIDGINQADAAGGQQRSMASFDHSFVSASLIPISIAASQTHSPAHSEDSSGPRMAQPPISESATPRGPVAAASAVGIATPLCETPAEVIEEEFSYQDVFPAARSIAFISAARSAGAGGGAAAGAGAGTTDVDVVAGANACAVAVAVDVNSGGNSRGSRSGSECGGSSCGSGNNSGKGSSNGSGNGSGNGSCNGSGNGGADFTAADAAAHDIICDSTATAAAAVASVPQVMDPPTLLRPAPTAAGIAPAARRIAAAAAAAAGGGGSSLPRASVKKLPVRVPKFVSPPAKKLRILVVDDTTVTRKMIGRMLADRGHDVSFASDGEEFLIVMKGPNRNNGYKEKFTEFDAILIDRHMSKLTGPEATRFIRERGYTGLIIGLNVDTAEEDSQYFKKHGANEVLPKPFKISDFENVESDFTRRQLEVETAKRRAKQEMPPRQQLSGMRILVVDDSGSTRKVMGRLLMKRGHTVAFAEDGEEFVKAAADKMKNPFDVVLIGRQMPKLEGTKATRQIRGMGYRGLIVGLSGDVGDAIVKEFLQHGADDVLPKPFNVDDLDQIVVDFRQCQKERKAAAEQEKKAPPVDALGGLCILVVDDSGSTRKVMGRLLTKKGHTVAFAEDGEEFLKVMQVQAKGGAATAASAATVPCGSGSLSQTESAALDGFAYFDVILIDRHMPKLEGPEAIRQLRAKGYKGLVVGLSGDTGEEDVKYFKDHGADSVLPKPFNIDELDVIVKGFRRNQKDKRVMEESGKESESVKGAAAKAVTRIRTLVVDDSSATRKVMGRLLTKKGHDVAFAEDGREFLKIIEDSAAEPFDVVLIDRHMPKLEGPAATRIVRAKGYKGLIVGLTGDTEEEDVKYFKDHGADAVLPKPFNVDVLDEIVENYRRRIGNSRAVAGGSAVAVMAGMAGTAGGASSSVKSTTKVFPSMRILLADGSY